jgi:hypothetical protein
MPYEVFGEDVSGIRLKLERRVLDGTGRSNLRPEQAAGETEFYACHSSSDFVKKNAARSP